MQIPKIENHRAGSLRRASVVEGFSPNASRYAAAKPLDEANPWRLATSATRTVAGSARSIAARTTFNRRNLM